MTLKDFALALLLFIIGGIVLFKFLKWLYYLIKTTHNNYLHSEKYAFKKVLQSLHKHDSESFYSNLKKWILQLHIKEKTMDSYLEQFGSDALKESYDTLLRLVFKEEKSTKTFDYQSLAKNIKISRKEYFKHIYSMKVSDRSSKGLNPVS
jgi:ribonucleotide reductase beta subunit family protein with ferritin-like domain